MKQELTLGYPKKGEIMARHVSPVDVQTCRITFQPSQKRHSRCIYKEAINRDPEGERERETLRERP